MTAINPGGSSSTAFNFIVNRGISMRSKQVVAATSASQSWAASSDRDTNQNSINISGRAGGLVVPPHRSIAMFSRKFLLVSSFLLVAGTVSCLHAQAGDPAVIQQKLYTQFKLTTITADRSDIVTAGDVVAIQKPGLIMYAVASPMPPSNSYKNGRIVQGWGGFGKDMLITMAAPGGATATDYPHRPFAPEERCWVTGIQVQKDGILFQLYSDPYDGIRYYANLKIPFPNKKEVPPVDTAMQLVAEVLTVAPQDQGGQQAAATDQTPGGQQASVSGTYIQPSQNAQVTFSPDSLSFIMTVPAGRAPGLYQVNGDTLTITFSATGQSVTFRILPDRLVESSGIVWRRIGGAPAPAPEAATVSAPPPPAPAPMADIPPPPPPTDTPPPTIAIGQTMDQVTAAFGAPLKVARLGAKVVFYYKDMKVTFTNGKVTDVE